MLEYIKVRFSDNKNDIVADISVKHADSKEFHFPFLGKELRQLATGRGNMYHSALTHVIDRVTHMTIYNMNIDITKNSGETTAEFINFSFPRFLRKLIYKIAKKHHQEVVGLYAKGERTYPLEIVFDQKKLEKFEKLHSQGSGLVKLNMSAETSSFLEESLVNDNGSLKNSIDHLKQIAANQTFNFWEEHELHLSKDLDGFNFYIKNVFNGGVVNHGSEKEPDWSIHT